ncbi:uncharacterized protein LOC114843689 [Betta splendens]|uniref:Uncharacterized protein LOC114843689 n=1 Tax=Betta splendens TaxID=158456 RepID=A0A9W2XBP7_BETSP|nr:uncharacterized protein LOC114843689 [Betta splendens]
MKCFHFFCLGVQHCVSTHRANDQHIMRTQNSCLFPLRVWILYLLLHCCSGDSELIGSSQPIVARVGDDVTLPCHLEPALDVDTMALEWTRPELNQFVYVWRSGQELVNDIHPSYRGRTSMFSDQLKEGNMSLKLSEVELSDRGTYRCFIPKLSKQALVTLIVAPDAVSSPVISLSGLDRDRGAVVLECRSGGWFPEPELLWLDAEGKLLSAGPTETVRGSDDLYTVSSRVTVDKRHSSRYTCRVQQTSINHTSEAHIEVTGNIFPGQTDSRSSSGSSVLVVVGLILCIMVLLAAVAALVVWKRRKNQLGKKQQDEETQNKSGANELEKEPLMEPEPDGERVTQMVENQNEMEKTQTVHTQNLQTEETEAEDEEPHDQGLTDEGQYEELMERETLSDVDMETLKNKVTLIENEFKSVEGGEKGHDKNLKRKLGQIKDKEKQISDIKKHLKELETQREETEKKMMDPDSQKEAAETHQEVRDAEKVELQKQLKKTEETMKRMMKETVYAAEQKHKTTSGRDKTVKKTEELKQKNKNLKTTSDNRLLEQTNGHKTDKTQEAAENKEATKQKGEKPSSSNTLKYHSQPSPVSSVSGLLTASAASAHIKQPPGSALPHVDPNRQQFFQNESLSVKCGEVGGSSNGRLMRKLKEPSSAHASVWETTGSRTIRAAHLTDSGRYWCEDGGGRRSRALNITVTAAAVVLDVPAAPVPQGADATLRCLKATSSELSAHFYKDGFCIGTGYGGELSLCRVSRSDEGSYRCGVSGDGDEDSEESWLSVADEEQIPGLLRLLSVACVAPLLLLRLLHCGKHTEPEGMKPLPPVERLLCSTVVYRSVKAETPQ